MQNIEQAFPGWRTTETIGSGAFGTVYRAVGPNGEDAAIKVISIPSGREEISELRQMGYDARSMRSHFKEHADAVMGEIGAMRELRSCPNVVRIDDYRMVENEDGMGWRVCIRMELLEPLSSIIERDGIPDQETAARVGADVSEALAACHGKGIIHRDVKPSNVFRSPDGTYKLGDFGLARHSSMAFASTKSAAGTPTYMAPR